MKFVQRLAPDGSRQLLAGDETAFRVVAGHDTLRDFAMAALASGKSLLEQLAASGRRDIVDLGAELAAGRLLPPVDHPDPAHLWLTGTGLTHLGSAEGRDRMHKAAEDGANLTDSMRMFLEGQEGGKPADGDVGQQPEWFYKGNGDHLVGPEGDLAWPSYAQDGSEEPEIAGIYLIGEDGAPVRLGFCLANEYSDHVTEKHNYLWLAHSKLRQAALGAELLTGPLPPDIRGHCRIRRGGAVAWEKPFLTGEDNMSHAIANLEYHHFKYAMFRRPGDIHVHFFGTATASFADGVQVRDGDVFEIEAPPFELPLRNRISRSGGHEAPIRVGVL